MKKFIFYFILLSFMLTVGCQKTEESSPKKELLIYCGITMIRPMQEIARIIEQKHTCTIKITKQGSGALVMKQRTPEVIQFVWRLL